MGNTAENRYQHADNSFLGTDSRDPEYLREHSLEVANRIRNLFWTVSGDYSVQIDPDVEEYALSRDMAVYDAVKQGALNRYFDPDAIAMYVLKKVYLGADEKNLTDLLKLCVECAVYPRLCTERGGTEELRSRAFRSALEFTDPNETVFSSALRELMTSWLLGELPVKNGIAMSALSLENAEGTDEIIAAADSIYDAVFPSQAATGNETAVVRNVDIREVLSAAEQDFLTDEQMERWIRKYVSGIKKSMLRLDADEASRPRYLIRAGSKEQDGALSDSGETEEREKKLDRLVSLHYGKSCLGETEMKNLNRLLCRGIHRSSALYFTEGILHAPVAKNYIYRFDQLQFEKNRMYYYANHRIIKKNISVLTDMLSRILVLKRDDSTSRATSGTLVPSRLWKVNRTPDGRLFDRVLKSDDSDFVVDILLDGSGSQLRRQSQVAAQGYIISSALSAVGIPHRVSSFCTFWKYTVLQRFRDYDDDRDADNRIFEFRASSGNRDGLSVKAVYDSLMKRREEHKILIILSDGRPEDIGRDGSGRFFPYQGEDAIRDTATEVRRARGIGISVLGIFAGLDEDLTAEKRIYGKDFAYIRDIAQFSQTVGTYLRKQIDEL